MSGLDVSRLSTNPTDYLSHPTAVFMTTQQSYPKEKEPWLDLSFLGDRNHTEKDFLCNYWRQTVADEQPMRLDYFLNVMVARERELWQGFSNDYVPSWAGKATITEVTFWWTDLCEGGNRMAPRSCHVEGYLTTIG